MAIKETKVVWHPATESPGMKRVLIALRTKDLKAGQYLFQSMRFMSPGVRPAECEFYSEDEDKQLPVAWAYYDEVTSGITPQMCSDAERAAWAWWSGED